MYDRDVANLFVPELFDFSGLREEPKGGVVEEANAAVAMLDPGYETASPAEVDGANLELGRYSVTDEVNTGLTAGTLTAEQLPDLRARWDKPTPSDSVVGAVKAAAEPDEDVSHVKSPEMEKARIDNIVQVGKDMVRPFQLQDGPLAVAGEMADILARAVAPVTTDYIRLPSIIGKYHPDLGVLAQANVGQAAWELGQRWRTMSEDEARVEMLNMSMEIEKLASLGYYSAQQSNELHVALFQPLAESSDPDAMINLTAGVSTAIQITERTVAVPLAGAVVKGAVKHSGTLVKGAVGLVKNTPAWAVSQLRAGQTAFANIIRGRFANQASTAVNNAASTEDLIDSIALPKVNGTDIDKTPYLFNNLVDPGTQAKLAASPTWMFGSTLVKRVNSMVSSDLLDGGVTMTANFGTGKNAAAFKTQAAAKASNTREFGGAGTVVGSGNTWYVQAKRSKEFGYLDSSTASTPDLTVPGTKVGRWLAELPGKMMYATNYGSVTSNVATRATEQAEAALARTAQPYLNLSAPSRTKVGRALDAGDENGVVHSLADLRTTYGLNDKEIYGYAAYRRVADVSRILDNIRLQAKATADGWLNGGVHGRNMLLKPSTEGEAVTITGRPLDSIRAIDGNTGQPVGIQNIPPNKQLVRLSTPAKGGVKFAVVDRSSMKSWTLPPPDIIPYRKGYLPRQYKYPHFVKVFEDGHAVQTLRGARSQLEAEELVAEMQALRPGADIRAVGAAEFRQADNADELEALDDAGLLYSSVRGIDRQLDGSGATRIPTVEDRLRKLMSDGAMSYGLTRWGDAQRIAWQAKFGDLFKDTWMPGQPTGYLRAADASDAKKVQRAVHEAEFINNVMGVGKTAANSWTRSIGTHIAEALYNSATRLDRVANKIRGDKAGSQLGNDLRDIGDNMIGSSGRILANTKTLPYLLFLAGNPIRQLPLQMTLIPSYFGVTGGAKYLFKGAFSRDFSILTASGLVDGGAKLAGKLGSDKELVEQFRRSGLMDSLEHHTMVATIGTTGTTSGATRFGDAVDGSVKALTNVGIGAGIKIEKVSAWLIARNRWKEMNPGKPIDRTAEEQILAFAEELSLNPNRSDTLPFNHGIWSVFTQFLSMQVKQIGRTFQALPGVHTGQLSKREARQMALVNLSVYGLGGYGSAKLADSIMDSDVFEGVDEETKQTAREALHEGAANFTLDAVLSAAADADVDMAFTESFSPNAAVGTTVDLFTKLGPAILSADYDTLAQIRWNAPALGLGKKAVEVFSFMAAVYGAPELPVENSDQVKVVASLKKAAQVLPALNNFMKVEAAIQLGAKFDTRGDPTVLANYYEAMGAMLGMRQREEIDLWALNNLTGSGMNVAHSDAVPKVRDAAYETSKWLLPLLDEMVDGKITTQEALKYINLENMRATTILSKDHHIEYVNALREAVDKRWTPKYNLLIERILRDAGTSKLPLDGDVIQQIANLIPDDVLREQVTKRLRTKLYGAMNESP